MRKAAAIERPVALTRTIRALAPGVLIALTIAAAAHFVAEHYGGPVMLLALLMGMALTFLSKDATAAPGIAFASKSILRIGVALLGLRIALSDIFALGGGVLVLVLSALVLTFAAGIAAAKALRERAALGVLIGGATAICGASAALALSTVLPAHKHHERDTLLTVAAVTTLSTGAMIFYPAIFRAAGFDDVAIGVLIGATIHDVAQVVGAGYAVSAVAGYTATIVKLLRVAMLLPAVVLVGIAFSRQRASGGRSAALPVPLFALAFAALVVVNSVGFVPEGVRLPLVEASQMCLVTAVAAVGLSTSLREIAKAGWPPILIALGASAVLLLYAVMFLAATFG